MAASGASSSFEWHGGGVELGAAEETRAHGGGVGMRPPGMWSFGVEGINTTADAGTSASGGVGSFGWNDGGVGLGADDEQRHEWRHLRVGAERPHGLQQQRHGVIGTLLLVGARERHGCCGCDGGREHGAEQRHERRRFHVGVWPRGLQEQWCGVGFAIGFAIFFALISGALVSSLCRRGRGRSLDFKFTSQLFVYFFLFATQTDRYA